MNITKSELSHKIWVYDEVIRLAKRIEKTYGDESCEISKNYILMNIMELISSESKETGLCIAEYLHYLAMIFDRLSNKLPLDSITEYDFSDKQKISERCDSKEVYQCDRYTSLFKEIDNDGKVTYTDVGRVAVYYGSDSYGCNNSFLAKEIVDKMFPITLPYYPTKYSEFDLYAETSLYDDALGNYDIVKVSHVVNRGSHEKFQVNRYFREKIVSWYTYGNGEDGIFPKTKWEEISKVEYVNLLESPKIHSTYKEGDILEDISKNCNELTTQSYY